MTFWHRAIEKIKGEIIRIITDAEACVPPNFVLILFEAYLTSEAGGSRAARPRNTVAFNNLDERQAEN